MVQATIEEDLEALNESYVVSVSDLPTQNLTFIPDVNITVYDIKDKDGYFLGNIAGWIDIVGFQNVARIGDVDYINATYEKSAILQHGVNYSFSKKCGQCYLDKMLKNVSIIPPGRNSSNRNVTAWLNVTMRWYRVFWVYCGDGCEYPIYQLNINYANFTDTDAAPVQFTALTAQELIVEQYNDLKLLRFDNLNSTITDYTVSTPNGSIERRLKIGNVEFTRKGVPFMNITDFLYWKATGTGIYHQMDDVIMENTTFHVNYETPFKNVNIPTNVTIEQKQHSHIDPFIFQIFLVTGLFITGIYIMHRVSS